MRVLLFLSLISIQACNAKRTHQPIANDNPSNLPQQVPVPAPATNPAQTAPSQTDPAQTDPNFEPVNPSQTTIDSPLNNGNSSAADPPLTNGNAVGSSKAQGKAQNKPQDSVVSNPFYVQNSQGQNIASMTVSYKIRAEDGSIVVSLTFVALTTLNDSRVGFPYHRLTIDFPQGDWKASKIVRNGHFRSNYYRIDSNSKKRDHFRIVLQALPQGATFHLEFNVPHTITKELSKGFELSLTLPNRQGRTLNFRDADGNSPAQLFKSVARP